MLIWSCVSLVSELSCFHWLSFLQMPAWLSFWCDLTVHWPCLSNTYKYKHLWVHYQPFCYTQKHSLCFAHGLQYITSLQSTQNISHIFKSICTHTSSVNPLPLIFLAPFSDRSWQKWCSAGLEQFSVSTDGNAGSSQMWQGGWLINSPTDWPTGRRMDLGGHPSPFFSDNIVHRTVLASIHKPSEQRMFAILLLGNDVLLAWHDHPTSKNILFSRHTVSVPLVSIMGRKAEN